MWRRTRIARRGTSRSIAIRRWGAVWALWWTAIGRIMWVTGWCGITRRRCRSITIPHTPMPVIRRRRMGTVAILRRCPSHGRSGVFHGLSAARFPKEINSIRSLCPIIAAKSVSVVLAILAKQTSRSERQNKKAWRFKRGVASKMHPTIRSYLVNLKIELDENEMNSFTFQLWGQLWMPTMTSLL